MLTWLTFPKILVLFLASLSCFLVDINYAFASFTFSIPQTNISSDQEIEATINLSLQNQGNKLYYLEGAFKREGATNYFGITWNDTDWVNYTASNNDKPLKSITTSPEGSWSGVLKTKLDTNSSQFTGSGNYILKINRFTATGSSPTPSDNEILLTITALPTDTPTPTETTTPTPTTTLTPTLTPTPTPTATPTPTPTAKRQASPTVNKSPTPSNSPTTSSNIKIPSNLMASNSSIAGVSISPQNTQQLESNLFSKRNTLIVLGGIFIISGTSILVYFLKKH
jgi:hypothetical protein